METIGDILRETIPKQRQESLERISKLTQQERAQRSVDKLNEMQGDLNDGYDCPKCKNRGFVFYVAERKAPNGETIYVDSTYPCQCRKTRSSIRRMKRSGLESIVKKCTFEKYEVSEEWQKNIKEAAQKFANEVSSLEHKWFFIGGGVGSGKTHLCTAIARKLLYDGYEVRYMLWLDESKKLKACVNDESRYMELIEPLKNADVLYIDDFLKTAKDTYGNEPNPTTADMTLAYEIINHRYLNPNLVTIISSERYIGEISDIDEAVGSRIYEMTKNNAYNIARDKNRNYRTKDMKML